MSIETIALIIGLSVTSIGAIFAIYDRFTKPDIKAENKINLLEQGCVMKHGVIDQQISGINQSISLIKENHLRHIEDDIGKIKNTQTKILTILEAKYQLKIDE